MQHISKIAAVLAVVLAGCSSGADRAAPAGVIRLSPLSVASGADVSALGDLDTTTALSLAAPVHVTYQLARPSEFARSSRSARARSPSRWTASGSLRTPPDGFRFPSGGGAADGAVAHPPSPPPPMRPWVESSCGAPAPAALRATRACSPPRRWPRSARPRTMRSWSRRPSTRWSLRPAPRPAGTSPSAPPCRSPRSGGPGWPITRPGCSAPRSWCGWSTAERQSEACGSAAATSNTSSRTSSIRAPCPPTSSDTASPTTPPRRCRSPKPGSCSRRKTAHDLLDRDTQLRLAAAWDGQVETAADLPAGTLDTRLRPQPVARGGEGASAGGGSPSGASHDPGGGPHDRPVSRLDSPGGRAGPERRRRGAARRGLRRRPGFRGWRSREARWASRWGRRASSSPRRGCAGRTAPSSANASAIARCSPARPNRRRPGEVTIDATKVGTGGGGFSSAVVRPAAAAAAGSWKVTLTARFPDGSSTSRDLLLDDDGQPRDGCGKPGGVSSADKDARFGGEEETGVGNVDAHGGHAQQSAATSPSTPRRGRSPRARRNRDYPQGRGVGAPARRRHDQRDRAPPRRIPLRPGGPEVPGRRRHHPAVRRVAPARGDDGRRHPDLLLRRGCGGLAGVAAQAARPATRPHGQRDDPLHLHDQRGAGGARPPGPVLAQPDLDQI